MARSDATQPGPRTDIRVEDWFGESVERDAEPVDRLTDDLDDGVTEAAFDERATGRAEQAARHGDRFDPDQGRSACRTSDS
jgi:hypothetical protein